MMIIGAVVLLVLVLNHDTVKSREQTFTDLRAEAVRLEIDAEMSEEIRNLLSRELDFTHAVVVGGRRREASPDPSPISRALACRLIPQRIFVP